MSTLSRNALPLEGQVAVVTGGAHGIGLGIVERLLGLGARVTASDIDESGLSLLCERLAAKHADAIAVHAADLTIEISHPSANPAQGRYDCRLCSPHDLPIDTTPHTIDLGDDAKTCGDTC